jgi:hypothetical protein
MERVKWIYSEGGFTPSLGDMEITDKLQPGVYSLVMTGGMMKRIILRPLYEKFEFPYKVYDLGIGKDIDRILETWKHLGTDLPSKTLGVLFHGTKGTGKTIAGKILSNSVGVPVICIPECYPGLEDFLSLIDFDCVLFIDEMEKVFDGDNSQVLLRILDGVYQGGRKLCIMTTNTLSINDNLLGRPGRIRYKRSFENLPEKMVREYVTDNLKDQGLAQDVVDIVNALDISTIDILKAVVEEMNIHGKMGEDELRFMNIPRKDYTYDVLYSFEGDEAIGEEESTRLTFSDFQAMVPKRIKNISDWDTYLRRGGWRSHGRKEKESLVRCLEIFEDEPRPKEKPLPSSDVSVVKTSSSNNEDDTLRVPHSIEALDALNDSDFSYFATDGVNHRYMRLPTKSLKLEDIIPGMSSAPERVLYYSDDYLVTEILEGYRTGLKVFYKVLCVDMLGGLYRGLVF